MVSNYEDWMQKTIEIEARDWRRPVVPESDADGHYTGTIVIFDIMWQHIEVSKTISEEAVMRTLKVGLEQIIQYGSHYSYAINLFKTKHFEDRSLVGLSYSFFQF